MFSPSEQLWSFTYRVGDSRFSFEIVAPTRAIAESALSTAVCEGAIIPASTACDLHLTGEGQRQP